MSDSEKTQKTRFVDGLDMKGEESKGSVRCLAWTTAKTNCHWLLWGDCGRIELGEKIRNSGMEMLYLKCLISSGDTQTVRYRDVGFILEISIWVRIWMILNTMKQATKALSEIW